MAQIVDYFCLKNFKSVCEVHLCSRVNQDNALDLESFAESMEMNSLAMHCATHSLKEQLNGVARESRCAEKLKKLSRL